MMGFTSMQIYFALQILLLAFFVFASSHDRTLSEINLNKKHCSFFCLSFKKKELFERISDCVHNNFNLEFVLYLTFTV